MTPREMVQVLKDGTENEKRSLYDSFFERLAQGETLDDTELGIFEALKKDLMPKPKQVVQMSAALVGVGGAQV